MITGPLRPAFSCARFRHGARRQRVGPRKLRLRCDRPLMTKTLSRNFQSPRVPSCQPVSSSGICFSNRITRTARSQNSTPRWQQHLDGGEHYRALRVPLNSPTDIRVQIRVLHDRCNIAITPVFNIYLELVPGLSFVEQASSFARTDAKAGDQIPRIGDQVNAQWVGSRREVCMTDSRS
jgi:hypothetical protein